MPTARDVQAIREVVKNFSTDLFVRKRIRNNVKSRPRPFSKERFGRAMLDYLLSSCQRVGQIAVSRSSSNSTRIPSHSRDVSPARHMHLLATN
jgi:hypothetical protein